MFKIYLCGDRVTLSGLDALDERRRLRLTDKADLDFCEQYGHTTSTRRVEVSEGFARLHFDRTQTTAAATVELSALVPSDVAEAEGSRVVFSPDISDDRVRELFAAQIRPSNGE